MAEEMPAIRPRKHGVLAPVDDAEIGVPVASFPSVWRCCNDAERQGYPLERVSLPGGRASVGL
jgi:hypothetical protein